MKKKLFEDLMRFAFSKKNGREKVKYIFLSLIYYFSLLKTISASEKGSTSATGSQSGDDIYPLF